VALPHGFAFLSRPELARGLCAQLFAFPGVDERSGFRVTFFEIGMDVANGRT
jgi:hypothetical protein